MEATNDGKHRRQPRRAVLINVVPPACPRCGSFEARVVDTRRYPSRAERFKGKMWSGIIRRWKECGKCGTLRCEQSPVRVACPVATTSSDTVG
jgi:ribosomal protein S27AE